MDIPSKEQLDLLHHYICRALGDPRRIQLLYALEKGSSCVTDLAVQLDIPQPTVSRHLGILRRGALVKSKREGTSVIYSLVDHGIIEALDMMSDLLRDSLERQANFFE